MCANCTYLEDCAQTALILHISRIVRKLHTFAMYTSCAHFAHVPNILLVTHILHICRMWFTSAQNECSTKQIAYIMYAAHVPDFCTVTDSTLFTKSMESLSRLGMVSRMVLMV